MFTRTIHRMRLAAVVAVITTAMWAMAGPAMAYFTPSVPVPSAGASATVNGVTVPVLPGMIIATGTRSPNGTECVFPHVAVEHRAPTGVATQDRIIMDITSDCALRVREVSLAKSGGAQSAPDPRGVTTLPKLAAKYEQAQSLAASLGTAASALFLPRSASATHGGAHTVYEDNVYQDCCGIYLTQVHAAFRYDDNGSSLSNGRDVDAWCWSAPDGWTTSNCWSNQDLTNSSTMYQETNGDFHWMGGSYPHWQLARARAYPGSRVGFCDFSGSLVPGGSWWCTGGGS